MNKIRLWINMNMNNIEGCIFVLWLGFVICTLLLSVGTYTEVKVYTFWDAFWLPITVVVFPFMLGYQMAKR